MEKKKLCMEIDFGTVYVEEKEDNSSTSPQCPSCPQVEGNGIPDAPEDGKTYARKDGQWQEIEITNQLLWE